MRARTTSVRTRNDLEACQARCHRYLTDCCLWNLNWSHRGNSCRRRMDDVASRGRQQARQCIAEQVCICQWRPPERQNVSIRHYHKGSMSKHMESWAGPDESLDHVIAAVKSQSLYLQIAVTLCSRSTRIAHCCPQHSPTDSQTRESNHHRDRSRHCLAQYVMNGKDHASKLIN